MGLILWPYYLSFLSQMLQIRSFSVINTFFISHMTCFVQKQNSTLETLVSAWLNSSNCLIEWTRSCIFPSNTKKKEEFLMYKLINFFLLCLLCLTFYNIYFSICQIIHIPIYFYILSKKYSYRIINNFKFLISEMLALRDIIILH